MSNRKAKWERLCILRWHRQENLLSYRYVLIGAPVEKNSLEQRVIRDELFLPILLESGPHPVHRCSTQRYLVLKGDIINACFLCFSDTVSLCSLGWQSSCLTLSTAGITGVDIKTKLTTSLFFNKENTKHFSWLFLLFFFFLMNFRIPVLTASGDELWR